MVYFSLLSEALFGLTLIIVTGGTEHNLIAALPDDNGIDLRCESGYCVSALDGNQPPLTIKGLVSATMALTYIIASYHYREISIIILITYMLFVCIYNILNIYY